MNLFPLMPKAVDWNKARLTAFGSGSLMRGIPGDYYAPSRFVRVAYLNTHYPVKSTEEENVSRLFHTLTGVAMIDGAAQMADGKCEITVYTGGYSAATKTYYYNTYENPAIVSVKMTDYNLDSIDLVQV
jgi:choloylglycine hydrolase